MASFLICLSSLFVLISALIQVTLNLKVVTPSRVAAPLGGTSMIPCQADVPSYVSIYWNRGPDKDNSERVVSRVEGNAVSGVGLTSGDFNLTEDGSLVIKYMRLEYESPYVCIILDRDYSDAESTTELIATVKPEVGPSVKLDCNLELELPEDAEECDSHHLDVGDFVNLTCRSGEARPAVELTWRNDQGTPMEAIFSEEEDGSLRGTFVTISTIRYQFKRTTTLTCQADGEAIGRGNPEQRAEIDLILMGESGPPVDPGNKDLSLTTPSNRANGPGIPFSGTEKKGKGLDLVIILVVVVAVAVGVVFILGIAVAVLYKKNKEYLDAISYSYCLSKDGYNSFFPRSGKSYHRAEPEDYIRGYNDTVSNKL